MLRAIIHCYDKLTREKKERIFYLTIFIIKINEYKACHISEPFKIILEFLVEIQRN